MMKQTKQNLQTGPHRTAASHELLLKAALFQGDQALQNWHAWHSSIDWNEHLDQQSYRLMPLLFHNLSQHNVKDPIMGKLKGIHRMAWYKNTTALRDLASPLKALQDRGIPTMLIKETASTVAFYPNIGLRFLDHFDILIPIGQIANAIECLNETGWKLDQWHANRPIAILLATQPALIFTNGANQKLLLNWQVLRRNRGRSTDENVWQNRSPTEINGVSTSVICPEDHLLQVCTERQSSPTAGSIGWVTDAMMVLRSSASSIDWDRLLTQAKNRLLLLPLRDSLEYLHASVAAQIPISLLGRLQDKAISRMERWEARYLASGYQHRPWADIPYFWFDYLRSRDLSTNESKWLGFVRYLCRRSDAPSAWQLPYYLSLACVRRIRRSFSTEQKST